jgi:hypothetical protein
MRNAAGAFTHSHAFLSPSLILPQPWASGPDGLLRGATDTLLFLAVFGVCIIGSFYWLNKVCCELDDEEQRKRYEELKRVKAEREAREAEEERSGMTKTPYQAAPAAATPSVVPYSRGGEARPYAI